jgi:hypothetical protein
MHPRQKKALKLNWMLEPPATIKDARHAPATFPTPLPIFNPGGDVAFTTREAVISAASDLATDGPNHHIRAQVRCTDGPPDVFHVLFLNDAAIHLTSLRESGQNPTLVIAGHLHSWADDRGEPQVELALTHLGLSLSNEFIWTDESETATDTTHNQAVAPFARKAGTHE